MLSIELAGTLYGSLPDPFTPPATATDGPLTPLGQQVACLSLLPTHPMLSPAVGDLGGSALRCA